MGLLTATAHEAIFTAMRYRCQRRGYPPNWEKSARVIVSVISDSGWGTLPELIHRIEAAIQWHEALWERRGELSHAG